MTLRTVARAFLAACIPAQLAIAQGGGEIVVDAGRGPVTVLLPTGYDPSVPAPLLMLLHGYGSTGMAVENYLGLAPFADAQGYAYLYPDGLTDSWGAQYWNAMPACCDMFQTNVDDSGYLRALLDMVKLAVNVDPARVHVVGHSNGGYMAYRLACDHAEAIASVASLAGSTYDDPADCVPIDQVHVLQIHGTNDLAVDYFGGFSQGFPYPGAVEIVEDWATYSSCSLIPDMSAPPFNLDTMIAGDETTISRYETDCDAGGSSELWTVVGGSHTPPMTNVAKTKVVTFFTLHRKPQVGTAYCTSTVHSGGRRARITMVGTESVAAEDVRLVAYHAPLFANGLFIAGTITNQVPFGDGFLCAGPPVVRVARIVQTNAAGEAFLQLDFDAPYGQLLVDGASVNFQFWFRDTAAGGTGFNLSDARNVVLGP